MKTLWIALLVAAPMALAAPDVRAQSPDDRTRAAARALSVEADRAWDKGDFETAYDRFTRAFDLVKALPLAVRQAECLEKMGKLVEASERYAFVANATLPAGAQKVIKDAVKTAQNALERLRPRVPMIELAIEGEGAEEATLLVDGKDAPRALWGAKMPVNPGKHTLELVRGDERSIQELSIEEGESKRATLIVPAKKKPAAPVAAKPVAATPVVSASSSSSASRTWGWIGLGVGGVGLAFGAATGLMAVSKQKSLDDSGCVDGRCPAATSGEVDSYNSLRTLSTVGFGVGLAGAAVGSVLLLTAPSDKRPEERAMVRGWIGPGSAGVAGTF